MLGKMHQGNATHMQKGPRDKMPYTLPEDW